MLEMYKAWANDCSMYSAEKPTEKQMVRLLLSYRAGPIVCDKQNKGRLETSATVMTMIRKTPQFGPVDKGFAGLSVPFYPNSKDIRRNPDNITCYMSWRPESEVQWFKDFQCRKFFPGVALSGVFLFFSSPH